MNSFVHAWHGIVYVFTHEKHFRFDSIMAGVVLVAGWFFSLSQFEWVAIIACIGTVLILEMCNSAVEYLVDIVKPRLSGQIKIVKDVFAGVSLVGSVIALIVGIIVFTPHVMSLLK